MNIHNTNIQNQFDLRALTFDQSAHWITDLNLIAAHVQAAGSNPGRGLEMCCGTGAVSRGMEAAGWQMIGVDISPSMVEQARQNIEAMVGDVAQLSFPDQSFDAVILRQAYFLLDNGPRVLKEAGRLLRQDGRLVISLTVPFNEIDTPWLKHVHTVKQAQMVRFFNSEDLGNELVEHGFRIESKTELVVRESVTRWMDNAPELDAETRNKVCDLVLNSPDDYRNLRRVELENDEILEDWNWVVYSAIPRSHL